jgi:trehalose 6-phosphate synthase/phosphatase
MAILNEQALLTIKNLLADKKNKVVIISGRECAFIDKQFSSLCDLTLVAEHGYFLKEIGKDWVCTGHTDLSWKKKILPVLNMYVDRCNGSMIEEKHASLAWHFRNAEEDIASIRMHELRDDLSGILREDLKLRVIEGHKVLEVKSAFYDKGTSATQLLGTSEFDFIMALGDDKTDEDLFNAIPEHGYTIKIGTDKPFGAKFNLIKQSHVYDFLDFLSGDQIEN